MIERLRTLSTRTLTRWLRALLTVAVRGRSWLSAPMKSVRLYKREISVPESVGDIPHKPHHDVRIASQSYSNIAAVLAGFAFAAVILVIEIPALPHAPVNAATLRNWATIAFLIALVGSITLGSLKF